MSHFHTIKEPAEGLYKEKGSKFLAFAFPVTTEEEIRDHLEELKKTYHDARHHCYAYILGLKDQSYRANDDGEPGHTAGDPILGQIRSKELTNCLVAVVRYFGGTKLGVGGLIHAYKTAAADALERAVLVSTFEKATFHLHFAYSITTEVERILSDYEIEFITKDYTDTCDFTGRVKEEQAGELMERLGAVYGVKVEGK